MKRVLGILVVLALLVPAVAFASGTGEQKAKTYTFAYMSGILDPFSELSHFLAA